ncbi:DUF2892 domain-containing protein [Bacillus tianshenii]|nr:DUF2892 domain-containing protein [Bacillus tianshenii]
MPKNIGKTDKLIRIVLGLVLLSLFFIADSAVKYVGFVGVILLLTSFINFCPLYTLFGLNTCKNKSC